MIRQGLGILALLMTAGASAASATVLARTLTVSDVSVGQEACGRHRAEFVVTLSRPPLRPVTVQYATADGTGVSGADYTARSGVLTFDGFRTVRVIRVPVADVLQPGPDKTFSLNLSNAVGATIADGQGVATIHAPSTAKCDDADACTHDFCDAAASTCRHVDVNACVTPFCSTGGACGASDVDGDGLSDTWEANGYVDVDCNGTQDAGDVALPGADPGLPDIYVKYDYMAAAGHDHDPGAKALGQVQQAFAAHGVQLHWSAPAGPIPERQVTNLDPAATATCAGDDFVTMDALRAQNLGPLGPAYHYMVFAHFSTCPDTSHCGLCPSDPASGATPDPTATGSADRPGDDAIVASANFGEPARIEQVASTILHELGHNLGLEHGGDTSVNHKPNYVSVMNYTYQFGGLYPADAPGSLNAFTCATEEACGPPVITDGPCLIAGACHCSSAGYCYRVDYSDVALGALDESNLDENAGVAGSPLDRDIVFYFVPGSPTVELSGPSDGSPIDWNGSGSLESDVTVDLNNSAGVPDVLTGWNDWETSGGLFTHLNFAFQCTPAYSGFGARLGVPERSPAARRACFRTDEMSARSVR